ncbi:MAG: hypothetical protein WCC95_18330 [Candidatus Sulfotelmatobacter sp.]
MSIRASVERYIARKAANFLQSRVKGLVYQRGASLYDPVGELGGWIFGENWWINVSISKSHITGTDIREPL